MSGLSSPRNKGRRLSKNAMKRMGSFNKITMGLGDKVGMGLGRPALVVGSSPAGEGLQVGDRQLDKYLEDKDRENQEKQQVEEMQVKERVERLDHREFRSSATLGRIINEKDDACKEEDFDADAVRKDINGPDGILRDIGPSDPGEPRVAGGVWWSTESEEVRHFRHLIAQSCAEDEKRWRAEHKDMQLAPEQAERILPQTRFASLAMTDPANEAKLDGIRAPSMTCFFVSSGTPGRIETLEWPVVPFRQTADAVIDELIAAYRVRGVEVIEGPGRFPVLKVLQTRGYIFGPTPLIDFLAIRRAVLGHAADPSGEPMELRIGLKTLDSCLVLSRASQLLPRYRLGTAMNPGPDHAGKGRDAVSLVVYYNTAKIEPGATIQQKADDVIVNIRKEMIIKEVNGFAAQLAPGKVLVLKVVGKADFIYGKVPLADFQYTRRCFLSNTPAKLALQVVDAWKTDETHIIPYSYENMLKSDCASCCGRVGADLPAEHKDITLESSRSHLCQELSLWDMNVGVEVEVRALSNILITQSMKSECKIDDALRIRVEGRLCHGTQDLCEPASTQVRLLKDLAINDDKAGTDGVSMTKGCRLNHTVWGAPSGVLLFHMKLMNLPRDARLCLTVTAHPGEEETGEGAFYLGWVNVQLFDHRDFLRRGLHSFCMWPGNEAANPIGVVSTPNTIDSDTSLTLTLSWPKFSRPVRFPHGRVPTFMRRALDAKHKQRMNEFFAQQTVVKQVRTVRSVVEKDPLYELSNEEKVLLWEFRNDLTENPNALSKFLQAVDWASPAAVQDCLHLLHHPEHTQRWHPPASGKELEALELLDARYANGRVREYAINILDKLVDSSLAECILQLVQVLKYEPYHYSALARFLLRRSVKNPQLIGHVVFWHLKAEMSNPKVRERHGLLLEELLVRLPIRVRRRFAKQDALIEILLKVGVGVKKKLRANERNTFIRKELDENFVKLLPKGEDQTTFDLPLDPRMECSGLNLQKCKTMDSKKIPLWLVFHNADPLGSPNYVMFKAGDDLRQDLLTLQIISMMDSIWRAEGLDLHMSPYGCVACDDGVGMIEVVTNSETIANITEKAGGAPCVFNVEPMLNWLRQQDCNKEEASARACMWNFLYSCAGYCVATYILGIGDRHNDNIMLKQDGTLFHIDFGHFLGNYKEKKLGGISVKRETTPFVFTPMYAHVLGGEKSHVYKHFTNVACAAYNIVRRHSHIIISLFVLMLSTGIPELQEAKDLDRLRKVFLIDQGEWWSDERATKEYQKLIKASLTNRVVLLNDYIHIMAHPKNP